ncbi:MAG: carbonic anhydrase [Phycisphaerae bacterium]
MNRITASLAALLIFLSTGCATNQDADRTPLQRLEQGNRRFVKGMARHPHMSARLRRDLTSHGQHPFATILACSDSRVPVELLFDQGIGDLFVIRVAGNVVGMDESGSIEYAVEHLDCPLIVVLGHKHCGAVTAAVQHGHDTPNIEGLLKHIDPAVKKARDQVGAVEEDTLIDQAVKENVWQSIAELKRTSELCRARAAAGKLKIVGAVYDIQSGNVEWMGTRPQVE